MLHRNCWKLLLRVHSDPEKEVECFLSGCFVSRNNSFQLAEAACANFSYPV